jgi:hypothetical protein
MDGWKWVDEWIDGQMLDGQQMMNGWVKGWTMDK